MQSLLQNIIQTGKPELITKYIDKYLPNDTQNLQRIYNQLNQYNPEAKHKQDIQLGDNIVDIIRQIKKLPHKKLDQTPIQANIRRSKSMVTHLKQKGFQVIEQGFQKGLLIAEKQKKKFLKPLQMNPITPFLQKGKINKLCQKYELNKQFYENPPIGFERNSFGFDPEMFQFIQKRKKVLKLIQQKKVSQVPDVPKSNKYKNVPSKIKNLQTATTNFQDNLFLLKISNSQILSKQQLKIQAKQIIEKCNDFYKIKQVPKKQQNVFKQLKQKLRFMEDINIEQAIKNKVNQKIVNQQLKRYNLSYITYLKQKKTYRSMSPFQKQLIKDQIKMRGLVNFQD